MSKIIEVHGLQKSYGHNQVLRGLDLNYEQGQIIGLLGPNGCGKTSLIKILTGLIHDYEGTVLIDGKAPGIYTKSVTAYLPERTYLPEWMKAKDAIDYFQDFFADFDKVKAMDMLSRFRLDPNQKIKTMSKGMQEKLQLLIVMSRAAKLYCLDEPLGGVDPATRSAILDVIMNNYADKSTVLISTHLINDVERIFNSVLMIGEGRVKLDASIDEIRESGRSVEEIFKEVFSFGW
ncbi:MAG: ABC transporter ATP-binding protein [Clostridia bacterium]|nr:ABC transporter ATP-binding protein [Clostridia bacterium]MBR6619913.1 ABC transporter ATP-binding protein [Clostridia bacterium]